MDDLRWSDDEGQGFKRPDETEEDGFASDFDESDDEKNDPSVTNGKNSKDYKRSQLFNGAVRVQNIVDKNTDIKMPNAIRVNPKLPLPQLPSSVTFNLETDFISFVWSQFIANGADASELIEYHKVAGILRQCELYLGLNLPPNCFEFKDTELDDYVDFKDVCLKFSAVFAASNTYVCRSAVRSQIVGLPPCCGRASCRVCNVDDNITPLKSNGTVEDASHHLDARSQRLFFAYTDWLTRLHGKLRNKHLAEILDVTKVPYDRNRLPPSWWELRGEFLIPSYEEFERLVEALRTEVDDEGDDSAIEETMKLPLWIRQELDHAEVVVLRCYFLSVCGGANSSSAYAIGSEELIQLCKTMGGELLPTEKASALIERHCFSKDNTRIDFLGFVTIFLKVKRGAIKDDALNSAYKTARTKLKLFEEIDDLIRFPALSAALLTFGGSPFTGDFAVSGPAGSSYEGGSFHVRVTFPDDYPFSPPEVSLRTKIYSVHVMVKLDGTGILPHLRYVWDPSWNIKALLDHISAVLHEPDLSLVSLHLVDIVATWVYQSIINSTIGNNRANTAVTDACQDNSEAKASHGSSSSRLSRPQSASASKDAAEKKIRYLNDKRGSGDDRVAASADDDNYDDDDYTVDAVDELWAMDQGTGTRHADCDDKQAPDNAPDSANKVIDSKKSYQDNDNHSGAVSRSVSESARSSGFKPDYEHTNKAEKKSLNKENSNTGNDSKSNDSVDDHRRSSRLSSSSGDCRGDQTASNVADSNDALQRLLQLLPPDYSINPDIQVHESLAALTKIEQIHVSILCAYLRSPEMYYETARQFVKQFATSGSTAPTGSTDRFDKQAQRDEQKSRLITITTASHSTSNASADGDDYYYYDNGFEEGDDS